MATKVYSNNIAFNFVIDNIRVSVVNISKEFPDPNWFLTEHFHYDYEIHIIESGQGYINLDGKNFTVKQNDLYITAPNVMHRQRSDKNDPMTELCIEFSIELLDNEKEASVHSMCEGKHLIDILSRKYTRPFQFGGEILKGFYDIIDNIEKKPLGYYVYTQALIVKLIVDIIRTVATHNEDTISYKVPEKTVDENRVEKIRRHMEINLNNSFTVTDAAKLVGISPKQLNRIMLKHMGMTFDGCIGLFRYKSALNLLVNTEMAISDVALSTGYSGTQQMYRAFLKYAGISPSKIQKEKRNSDDTTSLKE